MSVFRFKQFSIQQEKSAMKVGTDAMLLGSLVEANEPKEIFDIGTGTGVIALMLAQRFSEAKITAIEIDTLSYMEAYDNFFNSPWKERLIAVNRNLFDYTPNIQFDLIVSNPPYYQTRLENQDARKSQARHESALPMEEMLEKVANLLSDKGTFWVIIPSEVNDRWIRSATKFGLKCRTNISIIGKEGGTVKRNILEFQTTAAHFEPVEILKKTMTIRNSEGAYTNEYIELTREFHYNDLTSQS
ncbi:MAG: tRNA1(Val) (adenine(37)-N6)-methyltransferase [Fluviicola sp.]